jgi:putative transposase
MKTERDIRRNAKDESRSRLILRSADVPSALGVSKPMMTETKVTTNTKREANVQSRSQTGAPSSRPRRSAPPYNPGLQRLVEGKQAWAVPLDEDAKAKGFLGWHQRGYLPHYDAPWVTQIITLRLVDSLPASRRAEWEAMLKIENHRERRKRMESYLDRGLGECWLRQPAIAELTEGALRFFDGERYRLGAWVVMPNHVHLLLEVWDVPLSELVKSWKDFAAKKANKLLQRQGAFWEREYMDTLIEDEEHRQTAVRYIENNPTKAKLVLDPKEWRWSSARWRDELGVLKCLKAENRSQTGAPSEAERRLAAGLNRESISDCPKLKKKQT